MQTRMQSKHSPTPNEKRRQSQSGFSLLEMVVAMVIMTVGLLGVASAISYALMASNRGRGITNAKMLMVSILEQMETLRDTGQLHFNEISNSQVVGSTFTGFPATFQPVSTKPGPDGVFGTADDLVSAGADGIYGNSDDFTDPTLARPGVQRQILISTLPDNDYLKKIQITLRYSPGGGEVRELVCSGYLNDNEHGNYIP
jgi:prepilin-type N-terminal cleavage/methylation domain-containing protein